MRSCKKFIPYISILIIIAAVSVMLLSKPTIRVDGYSSDNVYKTIKELSSDKYAGRSYGSKGNEEAVSYVENQFKVLGLKPAGENGTYLESFNEIAKAFNGKAVMELLDKNGTVVKEYKYGEDFIEQTYDNSCAGDLTLDWKNISVYDLPDLGNIGINKAAIAWIYSRNDYLEISQSKFKALINIIPDNKNLRFGTGSIRGLSLHKSGYEMPVMIAKERVAKELSSLQNKGYKLHIKSTFKIESKKISNVLGMIPGRGDEYLFITAHLDHVGTDSDGTIHPGALDNASGVGTMLEIARFIKSQNVKPLKNIVFVAFNAEEGGLRGSYNYIINPLYPLYKSSVLNLDMVGTKRNIPISIAYNTSYYGNTDPSAQMRYTLEELGRAGKLDIDRIQSEASDHAIFTYFGVPAVTLIDYDLSKIHTPEDTIENIGKENLDRALRLAIGYAALNAYSNYSVYGFSIKEVEIVNFIKAQYPLFIILILSLVFFYLKNKKNKEATSTIPFITLLITIMTTGIISYFPLSIQRFAFAETAIGLLKYGFISLLKSLLFSPYFLLFMLPGLAALWICHSRIHSWSYQGEGKEFNIVYKLSMISVVVTSLYLAVMYNSPLYMTLAPVFARSLISKIIVNIIIALISYGIYKIFCREVNVKTMGFKNYIAFSLILFILLASFYTPIFVNGKTFSANSSSVNISEFSGDSEGPANGSK